MPREKELRECLRQTVVIQLFAISPLLEVSCYRCLFNERGLLTVTRAQSCMYGFCNSLVLQSRIVGRSITPVIWKDGPGESNHRLL